MNYRIMTTVGVLAVSAPAHAGYFTTGESVSSDNVHNIKLVIDPDVLDDPQAGYAAEIAGMAWSATGAVSIQTFNTGPEIHVHFSNDPSIEGTDCSDAQSQWVGCARFPSDGKPGSDIWLARDHGECPWTADLFLNTIEHELGHALGFRHPQDPNSWLIPGTQGGLLLYYTVMTPYPIYEPNTCELQRPWLSSDDVCSAQIIYGGSSTCDETDDE